MAKEKRPSREEVYELLEKKYKEYNKLSFIADDPVQIPHRFSKKQDIEIAGFFAATLAWGQRATIIRSATRILDLMDNSPHDFILHHQDTDLKRFLGFVHRTFNDTDLLYFIEFFRWFYTDHDSLEEAFTQNMAPAAVHTETALTGFQQLFFSLEDHPQRTRKHISSPARKSTCKRLNMYLRWMVRKDRSGVDFGIWHTIRPSQLLIPLDVHVDRHARRLGLLRRAQTDWQAVLELTESLRVFDPADPVKYDFALFGMGVLDK
ncbi:MAG: TIGR02757 family protein [Bacteroidetes bacterium]|nr:TIGR02757 family protein [Bacteroidota bacterium]